MLVYTLILKIKLIVAWQSLHQQAVYTKLHYLSLVYTLTPVMKLTIIAQTLYQPRLYTKPFLMKIQLLLVHTLLPRFINQMSWQLPKTESQAQRDKVLRKIRIAGTGRLTS